MRITLEHGRLRVRLRERRAVPRAGTRTLRFSTRVWSSALLLLLLLVIQVQQPAMHRAIVHYAFDQLQRLHTRSLPFQLPIRIVAIDQKSLDRHGQWPWPRERLARMMEQLHAMQARVAVLDLLISEPDRTSPHRLLALAEKRPALAALIERMPDHDRMLAGQLLRLPTVVGFTAAPLGLLQGVPLQKARFPMTGFTGPLSPEGKDPPLAIPHFERATTALGMFEEKAAGVGSMTQLVGSGDGVQRRMLLFIRIAGQLYPSLSLEALRLYHGRENIALTVQPGEDGMRPALTSFALGAHGPLVTAPDGSVALHYRPVDERRYISAERLLAGQADPALIRDHIVFIGATAKGLIDSAYAYSTLGERLPGVEIHAQLLEQLMNRSYLHTPDSARTLVLILLLLYWLLILMSSSLLHPLWSLLIAGLSLLGMPLLSWIYFTQARIFIDPIYPMLCMVLLYLMLVVPLYLRMARQQRLVQARSAFMTKVSHELRAPLTGINGLTDLCLETDLNPRQQDYLRKIQSVGQSMLGIVNDLLDVSKMEAGRFSLDYSPFYLNRVVRQVATLAKVQAAEKGLQFKYPVIADDQDGWVGDALRLGQVLTNLINNGIKFTRQGGLTLEIECLSRDQHGSTWLFAVQDSGPGMDQAQQARLFRPYSQIQETALGQGGTGLGLAISRQLVTLMGGAIDLISAPGKGSRFFFTVRLRRPDEAEQRQLQEQLAQPPERAVVERRLRFSGQRVLLVEDNSTNQMVLRELLERVGLKVTLAAHGEEALAALGRDPFALVLMDIQMPVMDGFLATAAIRDNPDFETLPIIAMTGHAMAGDREKSLRAGMNDHLTKPVDPDQLYEVLARFIPVAAIESLEAEAASDDLESTPFPHDLPGIDVEAGLRRVLQDQTFYTRLLRNYYKDHRQAAETIRRALREGRREAAWKLAHTLKGSAGNLGAMALYEASARLEADLKQALPHEDALQAFLAAFEEVFTGLKQLERPQDATSPQSEAALDAEEAVDSSTLTPQVQELREMLRQALPHEAMEALQALKARCGGAHTVTLAEIQAHIEAFQFDEALRSTRKLPGWEADET